MIRGLIGVRTITGQRMIAAVPADGGEIASVVSGNADHAALYAGTHGIARYGTDLMALLTDQSVGAVCITSTKKKHHSPLIAATMAGKNDVPELGRGITGVSVHAADTIRFLLGKAQSMWWRNRYHRGWGTGLRMR